MKRSRLDLLRLIDDVANINIESESRSDVFARMNNMLNDDEKLPDRGDEEGDSSERNSLHCQHCERGFSSLSNRRAHQCFLQPSSHPDQTELTLMQGETLQQFLANTVHSSDRQRMSLCSTLRLAVPGVWPLIFPK